MAAIYRNLVVGIFNNVPAAETAVKQLTELSFWPEEIGIIAQHDPAAMNLPRHAVEYQHADQVVEGAETGAMAGAGLGSLVALAVVGTTLPVVGSVMVGGLLSALALGATGGAVAGGLIGALVGLGLPEHEARYYETVLNEGRVIVTVNTAMRKEQAADVLNKNGAENMGPVVNESVDPTSMLPPPIDGATPAPADTEATPDKPRVEDAAPNVVPNPHQPAQGALLGGFTASGGLDQAFKHEPFTFRHHEARQG